MSAAAPLVLSVFSTFAVGGPQVRFAALANHFGRRWRHAVIAMDGKLDCAERLDPGLDVIYPSVAHRKGHLPGNVRAFRRALKELRPDVLMTSNWGTIEWAIANRPSIVRHIHVEDGFGPEERHTQLRRRVWMRRLLLGRRTVVLPSRTLWRIATGVWRLPEAGLRYLPNGVDLGRFRTGRARTGGGGRAVVGTVAALRAEKNLVRLLEAFRLLPEALGAQLVIAGDGPDRAMLEQRAGALGLGARVRFLGHVAEPAALYNDFDLFALSSDTEQMPFSVLEAMAASLPVAATEVGDLREMLAAENLPYLATRDARSLAAAMQRLLENPGLGAAIGDANRAKVVQDYSQEAMFETYAALIDG